MLTREIWIIRIIGWTFLALSVYDIAMRWTITHLESGVVPPSNDAVPFGLLAGGAFDLVGRALAKIGASASGGSSARP
jgi:hypothetical protein